MYIICANENEQKMSGEKRNDDIGNHETVQNKTRQQKQILFISKSEAPDIYFHWSAAESPLHRRYMNKKHVFSHNIRGMKHREFARIERGCRKKNVFNLN